MVTGISPVNLACDDVKAILSPPNVCKLMYAYLCVTNVTMCEGRKSAANGRGEADQHLYDWSDSEILDSPKFGELRIRSKTKAGPLEDKQLSRLGNIALVR